MKYFDYSRKDVRSLSVLYKICNILAVIPTYNFEKSTVIRPLWKRMQGLFLISVIAAGNIYSICIRHMIYYKFYTTTHVVLDYMQEIFFTVPALATIFSSCFGNQENWLRLNNNLQCIDKMLNNRNTKETNIFRKNIVQFVLYLIFYIVAVMFLLYTWINLMGLLALEAYATYQLCFAYNVVVHFLIYSISSALRCRFEDLNKLFKLTECDNKTVISFRKIGSISQRLTETVELFNKIFGTSLMFITGQSIVQVLVCLNFLVNDISIEDEHFKQRLFIANLNLVIFTLVHFF
jgi:hypothetical protein